MGVFRIKLRRVGRWKTPVYAIMVMRKDKPSKSGKASEKLGFYSPYSAVKLVFINFSRVAYWLLRGVYLTDTVGSLLSKVAPRKQQLRKIRRKGSFFYGR